MRSGVGHAQFGRVGGSWLAEISRKRNAEFSSRHNQSSARSSPEFAVMSILNFHRAGIRRRISRRPFRGNKILLDPVSKRRRRRRLVSAMNHQVHCFARRRGLLPLVVAFCHVKAKVSWRKTIPGKSEQTYVCAYITLFAFFPR